MYWPHGQVFKQQLWGCSNSKTSMTCRGPKPTHNETLVTQVIRTEATQLAISGSSGACYVVDGCGKDLGKGELLGSINGAH